MSDFDADPVRWFDPLGKCTGCARPATGTLRGPRNDSYGTYCARCAEARLNKARRERVEAMIDAEIDICKTNPQEGKS